MKLFKLLEGLYKELKIFNENVEYFSLLEKEKKRKEKSPLSVMSDVERIRFKLSLRKRLDNRHISISANSYAECGAKEFLELNKKIRISTDAREYLSALLGYASFNDMLEEYKRETSGKGGAATC